MTLRVALHSSLDAALYILEFRAHVLHWGRNRLRVEGSGGGLERPQKI